jgi:hypothetical protein
MSRLQRPRRDVSAIVVNIARPFLRYSLSRDAYVLRLIGNRRGPVLRPRISRISDGGAGGAAKN